MAAPLNRQYAGVRPATSPCVTGREAGVTSAAAARPDESARYLIYSHDTYGLGHFRRCLKIARQIVTQDSGCSVLLVTGSPLADRFEMPEGVDFVKLPAVLKSGSDEYRSRSLGLSIERIGRLRADIIGAAAGSFSPHAVLVDHAPLGLRSEILPMLDSQRRKPDRPFIVLGLRDIIDEPGTVMARWNTDNTYRLIEDYYDQILVYGAPSCFDPVTAYEFPGTLSGRTSFVGFVTESSLPPTVEMPRCDRPFVLVTVGGGEDGAVIVDAVIDAIASIPGHPEFETVILAGPLLAESRIRELTGRAENLPVRIEHFIPEVPRLMREADLVVSMGGYNSVAEILSHARRALIIPRESPRLEQLMRATRLNELGLVDLLRLPDLTATALRNAIRRAMSDPAVPLAQARLNGMIPLDGAARVASLLNSQTKSRRSGRPQEADGE